MSVCLHLPSRIDTRTAWTQPSDESAAECHAWFKNLLKAVSPGWIAGGALRDYFQRKKCDTDIDVFFPSMEAFEQARKSIEAANARKVYESDGTAEWMLGEYHIQFIKHRFYRTPEDTIAEFDFTVCAAAIDQWGRVIVHPQFFEDLAYGRLALNAIHYPVGTLGRLARYILKGFRPDNGLLLELAKAMRDVDFDDPHENKLQFYRAGQQRYGRFRTDGFCGDDEAA